MKCAEFVSRAEVVDANCVRIVYTQKQTNININLSKMLRHGDENVTEMVYGNDSLALMEVDNFTLNGDQHRPWWVLNFWQAGAVATTSAMNVKTETGNLAFPK